jgi:NADPH:quinone reductase-like Zn-dependent oxidoreductase
LSEPATLRRILQLGLGYDGLKDDVQPIARPADRQVLVRLHYAALNFRDLKILRGIYGLKPQFPIVPLSDGAGEVVAVGKDVGRWHIGDRVAPIYCQGWYSGDMDGWTPDWKELAGHTDGTAREYACFDEADLTAIPVSLSLLEAATLPCAGVTAWHALIHVGRLRPGETVLVQGSGGVSLFALQIARMTGARVIATSSDDAKLQRLRALGASDVINYRDRPSWDVDVRAVTGGAGVDHVVEVGGEESFGRSVAATRDGGAVHIVGNLTGGEFPAEGARERGIRTTLIGAGSRDMQDDLTRAVALNGIRPVVDRCFPLSALADALRYLESGKHFGKVLIRI